MTVEYGRGDSFYGHNLSFKDTNGLGTVLAVDPVTKRISGNLVGQFRTFNDAYYIAGGARWGIDTPPRVGDVVSVWWDAQGIAFARPLTVSYGFMKNEGDSLTDNGFADTDGGELHSHSFGHAESYLDNMGNWRVNDGMGDFIHLNTIDGQYRMRAFHSKLEEIGYKADGEPGVSLNAGLQDGEFDGNATDGYTPKKSQWHLRVNNKVWIDVSEDAEGNLTLTAPDGSQIVMDTNGIVATGTLISLNGGETLAFKSAFEELNARFDAHLAKFDLHTHIYAPGPLPPVVTAPPVPLEGPQTPITPTGTEDTIAG